MTGLERRPLARQVHPRAPHARRQGQVLGCTLRLQRWGGERKLHEPPHLHAPRRHVQQAFYLRFLRVSLSSASVLFTFSPCKLMCRDFFFFFADAKAPCGAVKRAMEGPPLQQPLRPSALRKPRTSRSLDLQEPFLGTFVEPEEPFGLCCSARSGLQWGGLLRFPREHFVY